MEIFLQNDFMLINYTLLMFISNIYIYIYIYIYIRYIRCDPGFSPLNCRPIVRQAGSSSLSKVTIVGEGKHWIQTSSTLFNIVRMTHDKTNQIRFRFVFCSFYIPPCRSTTTEIHPYVILPDNRKTFRRNMWFWFSVLSYIA